MGHHDTDKVARLMMVTILALAMLMMMALVKVTTWMMGYLFLMEQALCAHNMPRLASPHESRGEQKLSERSQGGATTSGTCRIP